MYGSAFMCLIALLCMHAPDHLAYSFELQNAVAKHFAKPTLLPHCCYQAIIELRTTSEDTGTKMKHGEQIRLRQAETVA